MARIICPHCGTLSSSGVVEAGWRRSKVGFRRKRKCYSCQKVFVTYEVTQEKLDKMEKTAISLTSLLFRMKHILAIITNLGDIEDLYLTETEAAKLIGIRVQSLIRLRQRGRGPLFVLQDMGYKQERIRYKYSKVIEYMENRYGANQTQEKIREYENLAFASSTDQEPEAEQKNKQGDGGVRG